MMSVSWSFTDASLVLTFPGLLDPYNGVTSNPLSWYTRTQPYAIWHWSTIGIKLLISVLEKHGLRRIKNLPPID
jgi:hypothetical protein